MLIAVTRPPSAAIARCLLTYMQRDPIDVDRAIEQHRAYRAAIAKAGATVVALPPDPDCPDSVFVEDNAVVVPELAVIASMASESRRREVAFVSRFLENHRPIATIDPPATLEGGDVFIVGRTLFVGLSTRTNQAGADRLAQLLAPHGYTIHTVPTPGCLHLTTGSSWIGGKTILANPEWVDASAFTGFEVLPIHPEEPFAANSLRIGDALIYPTQFPRTADRLREHGLNLIT
ncbi:MAG: arginine deiminase family protein, partial [Planctomycetota bacterium]|nr:arginine deiminase family protein [Planctomycetota bacterium]